MESASPAAWPRVAYRPMDRATARAEPLPSTWDAERVGGKMLEAFRINERLPRVRGPKQPGGAHPSISHSREDIEGQETIALNPKRFPPTRHEQTMMELVFGWLQFVGELVLRLALRDWMKVESKGHSQKSFCLKEGRLLKTFVYQKDRALAQIAETLNRQRVAVF